MKTKLIALLATAAMLAACTESDGSPGRGIMNGGSLNKQDVGTGVGVVGGALIGSAFGGGIGSVVTTVGGGLLGGWLGNSVGKSLDDTDRAHYATASQRALDNGRASTWTNPETGRHGTITPYKYYTNAQGERCRRYTETYYVDGVRHSTKGNACRLANGTWQVR